MGEELKTFRLYARFVRKKIFSVASDVGNYILDAVFILGFFKEEIFSLWTKFSI